MTESLDLQYQKKQHIDHIYDLPDTYTGSIEMCEQNMYVLDESKSGVTLQSIKYVPGFFKIFDEILVNAYDHRQRDPQVKNIKVHFSLGKSEILVWNDGKGIDVERHPIYKDYIVEMLFGQLLTSSNYEKDQKRTTGGKNGYGAKLTNIFSKKFRIETVDASRKKKYIQEFSENMKVRNEPVITNCSSKPYTCITFLPDYNKFECFEGITVDLYKLFEKRVFDMAGICPDDMNIFLNNEKLKCKNFEKYIELYLCIQPEPVFVVDDKQERWKVGIALSPNQTYYEVSFVNGIWTMKGGKHTEHVLNQILDKIKELLQKNPKTRGKNIKNAVIKDQIWLFVNCILENPSFTSQTKEECSSKVAHFGSKWECNDKMIEKFSRSGIIERILDTCNENEEKILKKSDGNKKCTICVPKLEDANYAGGKKSTECTLILTEGDSAKTSALSGLSVQGPSFRDYFGVFPLKGKFLNVRDASHLQILNNEEVKNLKKILGLQQGKEYTKANLHELRYGSVSLMTDQDSVTGDTPILCSYDKCNLEIINIQDIIQNTMYYKMENGKENGYPSRDMYVWTNNSWTRINKVIRHKLPAGKKLFRVVSRRGIVDVTEDHSLLDKNENKICPQSINAETKLLYSFPDFHTNLENSFFNQTLCKNKYDAQQIYVSEKVKGNNVYLEYYHDEKLYCVSTGIQNTNKSDTQNRTEQTIIYELDKISADTETHVYDLETENHKFQAGIGEMIVHNTDGSHIKGLVFNFFHHFFPSLLKIDGFLKSYITPIVRGFHGKETINFYTLADYEKFKAENKDNHFHFKYYKGLGTSSRQEMQEYFLNMKDITINYDYDDKCDTDMNMAFKKCMTNERKEWLRKYDPSETLDYERGQDNKRVKIDDFIHKDLKHFSNADNIRSIPNLTDGLKPSQRKVLYGTFSKCGSQNNSIKVAQLSGYISEKTCYHHGEMSLEQTIVNMSQKFVGKNNVNWLEPLGMFGTRLSGGKDHASSRYIFTKVSDITFKIFRKEDNCLLRYLDDDGEKIEPETYFPILPVVLLNGAEGIGTGYSTFVPSFHPAEVADACIHYAKFGDISSLGSAFLPWYDGFIGKIYPRPETESENSKVCYVSEGLMKVQEMKTEYKITIRELPIGLWTETFKEFLDEQISSYLEHKQQKERKKKMDKENKSEKISHYRIPISSYINRSTDKDIYFECVIEKEKENESHECSYWINKFKLTSNINISNMYLYQDNELVKFNTVQDIITTFCKSRLAKYHERKSIILQDYKMQIVYLENRIRFLEMVISGQLVVFRRKKEQVILDLTELGFVKRDESFDYCIKMSIDTFTLEKIHELNHELLSIVNLHDNLTKESESDLWIHEINEWKKCFLDSLEAEENKKEKKKCQASASKNKKRKN